MAKYAVIGKRLPRLDALEHVTGTATYSADIVLPNMLYGKVLRSPHPHAEIRRLDVTRAMEMDGVTGVITAADVPAYRDQAESNIPQLPRLAKKKVTYAGQPVAAVAAVDQATAEEAAARIEVDYSVLPPQLDVLENKRPGSPLICPGVYTQGPSGRAKEPSNVAFHISYSRGDLDAGFKQADFVLEETYRTQKVHQGYLEPMAAVASAGLDGEVTIWTQNQGIFAAREQIALFLGLPLTRVRVMPLDIGGAFGGKTYNLLAPLCALLALKTGRPVKMVMTREEVIAASRPAPASIITLKMGVSREGRILAASTEIIFDIGAFPERPFAANAALHGLGPYKIPNLKIEGFDVLTNRVPTGSYRAPATPPAAFAVESHMDSMAKALGMDPIQFRLKNAVEKGDLRPDGKVYPRIGFKETLERMAGYLKEKGELKGESRGRGIACGLWCGGVGNYSAEVHVNSDGSLTLVVGSVDLTGNRTSMAQIAAEEFCLPFEKVKVATGNTDTAPFADMTVGSRATYHMGLAVLRACQDAKAQLIQEAAGILNADPSEIEFVQGRFQFKARPDRSMSLEELAYNSTAVPGRGPVIGRGSVGRPPQNPMFAVHAVDVEVDKETGRVKVLSYAAAQDVGLAINPMLVEGQIQGAIAQGIGWALTEGYVEEKGIVQNTTLLDYRMPTAVDVPFKDIMLVEVPSETGPYGMRPVGEPPIVPCLGALSNAIHSAVGVRPKDLPISPEALFRAMRRQGPKE